MINAISQLSNYASGTTATTMKAHREEMLSKMDANGDGSVDKAEFTSFAKQLSSKVGGAKDPEEIFAEIDTDGDGSITKAESDAFDEKMAGEMKAPPPPREDMFSAMDADGDGTVDKAEFIAFGEQLADKPADAKDPEEMFSEIDTNGDGTISKAEMNVFDQKMESKMKSEMPMPMASAGGVSSDTLATLLDSLDQEDSDAKSQYSTAIQQYMSTYQTDTTSLLDLLG
jgi:Ca2+-binding EF-hand superfamily protein